MDYTNESKDDFAERLKEAILRVVRLCICPRCHCIDVNALKTYPTCIPCNCNRAKACECIQCTVYSSATKQAQVYKLDPHRNVCLYLSDTDLITVWLVIVVLIPIRFFPHIITLIYPSLRVRSNLTQFMKVARILCYSLPSDTDACHIVEDCMQLHDKYPNVNGEDFARGVHYMHYMQGSMDNTSKCIQNSEFEHCIRTYHNAKIHPMWNLWEMDMNTYTSFIQWLPHEILSDITQFTTQPASPYTFIPE